MRSGEKLLRQMLAEAPATTALLFPKFEAHPAGVIVGLGGLVLGILSVREPGMQVLGWIALGLCLAGMLMYPLLLRRGVGWRLHFEPARVEPVKLEGQAHVLGGEGWSVHCVKGSARRSLALEFRHVDGGRPLRFFQTRPKANRAEQQLTSQLADAISQRLKMGREGLTT